MNVASSEVKHGKSLSLAFFPIWFFFFRLLISMYVCVLISVVSLSMIECVFDKP